MTSWSRGTSEVKRKQLIRQRFRDEVFERDGHKCLCCDRTDNLDAHHITDRNLMPNGGYVKENGATLCPDHHFDAEQFHRTGGKMWLDGMHPNDLYRRIGSSYLTALAKSKRL